MIDTTVPIASRYRIVRELGRGGMGIVFLVEHVHTGDHLALKVLLQHSGASSAVIERFKREARAPARIKSENIVRVTDADVAPELDGAPFLVMELLDGKDLEKTIEELGAQPFDVVLGWMRQAARALDKAHAQGIVHRDLKPENLFLHQREDGSSVIKILDFGISKILEPDGGAIEEASLTKTGAIMGTPLYMAPEQAQAKVELIGPPTDQWALGLITYRLLTGQVYWSATTMAQLMLQIVIEPMPPPSTRSALPAAFDEWFARACDRDPGRRFRTVSAQVEALAVALGLAPRGSVATHELPAPVGAALHTATPIAHASESWLRSAAPVSRTFDPTLDGLPRKRSRAPWILGASAITLMGLASVAFVLRPGAKGELVPAGSANEVVKELASPAPPTVPLEPRKEVTPPATSAVLVSDAGPEHAVKSRVVVAAPRREPEKPLPKPTEDKPATTSKKPYDPAAP
jgi:serine/threonine protein kinase